MLKKLKPYQLPSEDGIQPGCNFIFETYRFNKSKNICIQLAGVLGKKKCFRSSDILTPPDKLLK